MINNSDITIIIPIFNLKKERKTNFLFILDSLFDTDIPVMVVEQGTASSEIKKIIEQKNKNVKYTLLNYDNEKFNKSKMVNFAVSQTNTKYIWEVDADVYFKWNEVLKTFDTSKDVIKPFSMVIRLSEQETKWFVANKKIKMNKGDVRPSTSAFGPLSFIVKTEIFKKIGMMNEEFNGWSWEDIELAKRLEKRYNIFTPKNIFGLHLWHEKATSNEKENIKIYEKSMKKLERPQKKETETTKESPNIIPENLKNKSSFVKSSLSIEDVVYDLSDLTVVIPVKIDTKDRLHNLEIVLNYFKNNFKNVSLIVIEQDVKNSLEEKVKAFGFDHIFRENYGCFHKTWNFNLAIASTNTKYILAYDCDAIFKPKAIFEALQRLKENKTSFIYPYNTYMVQIKKHCFAKINTLTLESINNLPHIHHGNKSILDKTNFDLLYGDINWDCTGGALMFNKKDFFLAGAYNPNIISYGCEDNEIDVRVKKLNYTVERLQDYNCYHLEHDRSTDSHYNNFFKNNESEFQKIKQFSDRELFDYVNNGYKNIKFDTRHNLKIINTSTEFNISLIEENKIDLSDLDIIMPVFVDTDDRIRNIETVLKYLEKYFKNYKVYLTEFESNRCKYLYHKIGIEYIYVPTLFNKTQTINTALQRCKNKFVCVWDADALITPSGVEQAMNALRTMDYHFAFPYNGWFIDIRGETLQKIFNSVDISDLFIYDSDTMKNDSPDFSVRMSTKNRFGGGSNTGGCVIFNRETLNKLGNYNENFWQWGFEDDEIDIRFEIMGYERFNSKNSNCYHMEHSRNDEANGFGTEYINNNSREYHKVLSMNKESLSSYIASNFTTKLTSITLVDTANIPNNVLNNYIIDRNVKEILTLNNIEDKKIRKTTDFENLDETSTAHVILQNVSSLVDTGRILDLLTNNRRCVIVDDKGTIIAYKKEYYKSILKNDMRGFVRLKLSDSQTPICSIILTTYGKETLMTQEYFDRIVNWKEKCYEVIVVVHDESPIHRLLLSYYKSVGVIDKLIFASPNHGHLKGVALGVAEASSDIIINANNDVRISKTAIDWCVNEIKADKNIGLIGWHYDNKECEGTFWNKDGSLSYTQRPNSNELLTDAQWAKIESAPWYTGKIEKAIGKKRILAVNGSFFCTRKSIWNTVGGMNPEVNEHYFADDYFCYGVIELGFNIKNLHKDWRDSSKPEIFLSMSDYVWKGKEIESKHKNYVKGDDITEELYKLACYNKSVCVLGKNTIPASVKSYKLIRKINEKADCIIMNDLVTDVYKLQKYLNPNGVILFESVFEPNIKNSMKPEDNLEVFGNLGVFYFNTERKQYANINIIKNVNVSVKSDIQKFVVLRTPRVGYNNLKLMLEKHPDIHIDLEIFEDNRTRIGEVMSNERQNDPSKFLECYYDLVSTETNKKCLGYSVKTWDKPENIVEKVLSNDKDMKFILLRRKNSTKAMVDCAWANTTGKWHVTKTEIDFQDFNIDVNWANGWLTSSNLIYSIWKQTLEDKNINYLEVFYEDLYADLDNGIKNICNFLNVRNVKLWPIFKKSTGDGVYDSVLNRDEINKVFGERYGKI